MARGYAKAQEKIIWTRLDQLQAIGRGVFVAHHKHTSIDGVIRYNAIPMASLNVSRNNANCEPITTGALTLLERRIALEAFRCDPLFEKMERFILQQRLHGWSGAWGDNCGSARSIRLHILKRFDEARSRIGLKSTKIDKRGFVRSRRPNKNIAYR